MALAVDGNMMGKWRAMLGLGLDVSAENIAKLHPDSDEPQFSLENGLPKRSGYNTLGKQVKIRVNQFKVTGWPEKPITQFDIKVTCAVGKSDGKDIKPVNETVIKKCFHAKKVTEWREKNFDKVWIFDGKKIAWNRYPMKANPTTGLQEHTIRVDLSAENNQPSRGDENAYNITFKQTTDVKMVAIGAWLNQEMDFSNNVYEAINFLDHLMRQSPSEKYTQVKRCFFDWNASHSKQHILQHNRVDNHIELIKGVYASMRLCHKSHPSQTGLAVNIDVANGLFWTGTTLQQLIKWYMDADGPDETRNVDWAKMAINLRPRFNNVTKKWDTSDTWKELRRFVKLKFTVNHRKPKPGMEKETYTIKRFVYEPHHDTNQSCPNAKNTYFDWTNKKTGVTAPTTVYDYFLREYNGMLRLWNFPVVESVKGGFFPIEVCDILPKQRYPFKTNPEQTAKMIKLCVERPHDRWDHVQHGLRMLNWAQDPYLKHFAVKIDSEATLTEARVLDPPQLLYAKGKKLSPGVSGRWVLKDVKFLKPNPEPLKSWGMLIMNECINQEQASKFVQQFVNVYTSHGASITTKIPQFKFHPRQANFDTLPKAIEDFRQQVGSHFKAQPQILFVVLGTKSNVIYERLKRNAECRWGIVSQMMQSKHVVKASPQYCTNVAMKVNAKLGGTTNTIAGRAKDGSTQWFTKRTMVLGADVSHPGFGAPQSSMASLSMNADKGCMRYWAGCQTNGFRVEMIREQNIEQLLIGFFPRWIKDVGDGKGPEDIYYFRDGVSEGQYDQVIGGEVAFMKAAILKYYPMAKCRFVVVVCGKRHKIRFFPNKTDKLASDNNGNPHPGTLVERDVTHPFENDFYLSSHSAIQGTARPTHYHVIVDEIGIEVNKLHTMIYHHCYQFIRSTTPVSLYPAVYYAHLAAARCRAHESKPYSWIPRTGQKFEEYKIDKTLREAFIPSKGYDKMSQKEKFADDEARKDERQIVYPKLNALGTGDARTVDSIKHAMWYI